MRARAMRRAWRGAGCAGIVAAALAGTAAQAPAATLSTEQRSEFFDFYTIGYTDLHYRAAAGEANDLLVFRSAGARDATWYDAGAPIHIAPEDEFINQRLSVNPFGTGDLVGCSFAYADGTLVGDRVAVGAASCLYVEGWDPCDTNLNPYCQGGSIPGFTLGVISTGDGDDTVRSADGRPDRIDCGPGRDTAMVDGTDTVTGCEVVLRS